ncbi:MAG: hypothetical protein ACFFCW_04300 [Candidatus Hodarchaeota archaeon]
MSAPVDNRKLSENEKAMAIRQKVLTFFDKWKAEFKGLTTYSELDAFWWNLIKRSEELSNFVREEIQFFKHK